MIISRDPAKLEVSDSPRDDNKPVDDLKVRQWARVNNMYHRFDG